TPPTEIYTLSLHDALPIWSRDRKAARPTPLTVRGATREREGIGCGPSWPASFSHSFHHAARVAFPGACGASRRNRRSAFLPGCAQRAARRQGDRQQCRSPECVLRSGLARLAAVAGIGW